MRLLSFKPPSCARWRKALFVLLCVSQTVYQISGLGLGLSVQSALLNPAWTLTARAKRTCRAGTYAQKAQQVYLSPLSYSRKLEHRDARGSPGTSSSVVQHSRTMLDDKLEPRARELSSKGEIFTERVHNDNEEERDSTCSLSSMRLWNQE